MNREAMHYKRINNNLVTCNMCPHNCHIGEGQHGICGTRFVREGVLRTINYGQVSSLAMDPIEKKPLFHFKPGKSILSVGSFGCNFSCAFCQNYSISKEMPRTEYIAPEELISIAEEAMDEGNVGIAFTYNEPSVWYEYVYDTARILKSAGLDIVLVTNGFIGLEPLREVLPFISAMNIDLKAFNERFYREVCGGNFEDVLKTIDTAASKCHVEITTLLVNGQNDSDEEVEELSKWIASVKRDMPLHLTRYYPSYKFDKPATSIDRIIICRDIARKHLNYVYTGNVSGMDTNTYCPECGKMLIERKGYRVNVFIEENVCPECRNKLNIVL